ncbi:MAG: hypothetical protein AAB478_02775 [Patescibacteria group bacterium]|mgnify:CR=1 FL=1
MRERDGNGVSRRAILGAALDKTISQDPLIGRAADILAPETRPQVQRLRELQEGVENIPTQIIASAIGDVIKLYPIVYQVDSLGPGMNYVIGAVLLPLGSVDVELQNIYWHGIIYSGIEKSSVHFNPDSQSLAEVHINFDGSGEDTGMSNYGAAEDFNPLIQMSREESDLYGEELDNQGFLNFDQSIILEAIYQAVVYGERSTYWQDTVVPMLRMDELTAFNRAWHEGLLRSRNIDPELFEVVSRQLPIRESMELIKSGGRIKRLDAMRYLGREATRRARDLLVPRNEAGDSLRQLNGRIIFNETDFEIDE